MRKSTATRMNTTPIPSIDSLLLIKPSGGLGRLMSLFIIFGMILFNGSTSLYSQGPTIDKFTDDTVVQSGETITYEITAGCDGLTTDCPNFVVCDEIPMFTELMLAADAVHPDSGASIPSFVSGTMVCWDFGTVSAGSSLNIQLIVTVDQGYLIDGEIVINEAMVTSGTQTVISPVAETTVESSPEWNVSKTGPGNVYHGDNVTYTIRICNVGGLIGTQDLYNPMLVDVLAPGAEFVSATNGGTYNMVSGEVTWNFADLLVQNYPTAGCFTEMVTVRFPLGPLENDTGQNPGTPIPKTNTATLSGTPPGGGIFTDANGATSTLQPPFFAISGVGKTAHDNNVLLVDSLNNFTITFGNGSTKPLDDFMVCDVIPSQFSLDRIEFSGCSGSVPFSLELHVAPIGSMTPAAPLVFVGYDSGVPFVFDVVTDGGINPAVEYVYEIKFKFGTVPRGWNGCSLDLYVTDAFYPDMASSTGHSDNYGAEVDLCVEYTNCVTVSGVQLPEDGGLTITGQSCDHMTLLLMNTARLDPQKTQAIDYINAPAGAATTGNAYYPGARVRYCVTIENDGQDNDGSGDPTGSFNDMLDPVGVDLFPDKLIWSGNNADWWIQADNTGRAYVNDGTNPTITTEFNAVVDGVNPSDSTKITWRFLDTFVPEDQVQICFWLTIDPDCTPGEVLRNDWCINSDTNVSCDENMDTKPSNLPASGHNYDSGEFLNMMDFMENPDICCKAVTLTVVDTSSRPEIDKRIVNLAESPFKPNGIGGPGTDTIEYEVRIENDIRGNYIMIDPIVGDLISEKTCPAGNFEIVANTTGLAFSNDGSNPTFLIQDDYQGSGQQFMSWAFDGDFPIGTYVTIRYKVGIKPGQAGAVFNEALLYVPENSTCTNPVPDDLDINGNGNTSELICRVADDTNVNIATAVGLSAQKFIFACEERYISHPDTATILPGQPFEYKIKLFNPGNLGIDELVIIDILPFVGDMGVRLFNVPRSSEWRPMLMGPVNANVPGGMVTTYYSTEGDPCRSAELILDAGENTDCTPPAWTTTPLDYTAIRSLKFEFDPSFMLNPLDSVSFTFDMLNPAVIPPGAICNSFAWKGRRADNNRLLRAEPNQVCAQIKKDTIGNYVWIDVNEDGLQDGTDIPLPGITMALFDTQGNLMATTTTDANGEYYFTSSNDPNQSWTGGGLLEFLLPDSTYYVVAAYNENNGLALNVGGTDYVLTIEDAGGDDAIDSDGSLAEGGDPAFLAGYIFQEMNTDTIGADYTYDFGFYEGGFDLALIKTISTSTPGPYEPGATVTFNLTVFNQGDFDAYNVNINDYIPTGLVLADPDWIENAGVATLLNPVSFIAEGGQAIVTITFTIANDFSGTSITNNAEIGTADNDTDPNNTPPFDIDSTPGDEDGSIPDPNDDDTGDENGGDDYDPAVIPITQEFDLALTKSYAGFTDTNGDGMLNPGESANFMITVYNQGTLEATGVEVTDYVPSDMIFNQGDNIDFSGLAPGSATAPIAMLGIIPAGSSTTVSLTLEVNVNFMGDMIVNDAEITAADNALGQPDEDSTPGDNSGDPSELGTDNNIDDEAPGTPGTEDNASDSDDYDPALVMVGQVFDLAIDKLIDNVLTPGPYEPGDQVEFVIMVYNQGTLDATNVVVEDYIPTGMNFVSSADFSLSGSQYTTTIASLPKGASQELRIRLAINPSFMGTQLINNVEIIGAQNGLGLPDQDDDLADIDGSDGDGSELDTNNDTNDEAPGTPGTMDNPLDVDDYDPEPVAVVQTFDLALIKTINGSTPGPYAPGGQVTFNITVVNQGTLDAYNVNVNDYVPAGLTVTDPNWGIGGGVATLLNPIPFIGIGTQQVVTITFAIDANFMGSSITNNAEIGSADDDLDPNNTPPVDVDSDPNSEDGSTPDPNNDDVDDVNGGDDYDPETINLTQNFDLALIKLFDSYDDANANGMLDAGENVDFTITIYNQGTLDATGVEVTDYVPADMIFNEGDNTDFSGLAPATATTPLAVIGNLAAGSSTTVTITLQVNPVFMGDIIVNDAEITAADNALGLPDEDSTPGDNSGDASELETDNDVDDEAPGTPGTVDNASDSDDYDPAPVMVNQVFDLAIDKLINNVTTPGPYLPGDVVDFNITVYNQGTLDATNVVVEDYLPTGMSFDSSPDFSLAGVSYQATILSLPAGVSQVLTITLRIDNDFMGTQLVNNVEIIGGENALDLVDQDDDLADVDGSSDDASELDTDNDVDDEAPGTPGTSDNGLDVDDYDPALVEVTQIFDLALEKTTLSAGPYVPGGNVTFSIEVWNQGTQDAYNIELEDYFPPSLILADASWTLIGPGVAILNNDIDYIAAGEKESVNITFQIDPSYMGSSIINYAEIMAADNDNNPANTPPVDADSQPDDNAGDDELANDGELVDSETGELQDDDPDSDDYDPELIDITHEFDLALIKLFDSYDDANANGLLDAGENVDFTITVYNQGTLDATGVEVTDYVPADMIFNEVDNTDFSGLAPATATTPLAVIGNLAAGSSTTVTITLQVDPVFMGDIIVNDAEITAADNALGLPDEDSTPGDNSGDASELETDNNVDDEFPGTPGTEDNASDSDDYDPALVLVSQAFDLAIDKLIDNVTTPGPYFPGDVVNFNITVYNQGTLDATNVVVEDYLPTGMSFDSSPDFSLTGITYQATILSLPAGASQLLTISLRIDNDFMGAQLVNNVEIIDADNEFGVADQDDDLADIDGSSNDESELDTDNDVDDEAPGTPGTSDNGLDVDDYDPELVLVEQIFDLALEKTTLSAGPYVPGGNVTFTIEVWNQGTQDAYNVELEDYFPPSLILADNTWTLTGSGIAVLNNDIDYIAVGERESVNITFQINPSYMGSTIINYAEIMAADNDNNPGNTPPVDADSQPDNNAGDDELANDGELVDTDTGELQDDDPDSDDYDPELIDITHEFDLALIKLFDSYDDANANGVLDAGENVDFTITIYNQGTLDATGVEVTDYVPADMIFNEVDNTDFSGLAPATATTPLAVIGNLAAGSSATVTITLQVDPVFMGDVIVNDAEITAADNALGLPDEDSTPGDNSGDASELETDNNVDDEFPGTPGTEDNASDSDDYDPAFVLVNQVFDLAIDKLIDNVTTPGPYFPGDVVNFNITVYNQGTLDATNVVVEDYLPTGMSFDSSPDFSLAGVSYQATILSLPAGASQLLTISLRIDNDFMGAQLVNNVEIIDADNEFDVADQDDDLADIDGSSNDESELDTDNDVDDEAPGTPGTEDNDLDVDDYDPELVLVEQIFDLALEKTTSSAGPYVPGGNVTFSIEVWNQGTQDAYNVELEDYFPPSLILSDNTWTLTDPGVAMLNNDIDFIAAGEMVSVNITFQIDPSYMGSTIINYAEIMAADNDNDPGNTPPVDADSEPDNNEGDDELANDGELVDTDTGELQDDDPDSDDYDPELIDITHEFDLALTKIYSGFEDSNLNGVLDAGENVDFTVTVYNQGTLDATGVEVTDYVPTDMIFEEASNGDFSSLVLGASSTAPIAQIGALPAGGSVSVILTLRVDPLFQGDVIVNDAEITTADNALGIPDEDSTPGDNSGDASELETDNNVDDEFPGTPGTEDNESDSDDFDPAMVLVGQSFDLAIMKVISGHINNDVDVAITPGDYIEFSIDVHNQGTLDATNVIVEDYIPAGMSFVSSPNFSLNGSQYTSTISSIPAGSPPVNLLITLEIDLDFMGTQLVNNAEITYAENELGIPDQDDDLGIIHGSSGDESELDTDNNINDEAPGTPGMSDDPTDADDYDPALVEVTQIFDLALEKIFTSSNTDPIAPGSEVTFTLEVWNQGTQDAYNVELLDYYPLDLILTDPNWTETGPGVASLDNDLDFIGTGEMASVNITFTVSESFYGDVLVNYGEISGADNDDNPFNGYPVDEDSTPGDNQGDDELANDGELIDSDTGELQDDDEDSDDYDPELIMVSQIFDLALQKVLSPGQDTNVDPGDPVRFTIRVHNQGTIAADNISLIDYIPLGMTFDGSDATNVLNMWMPGGSTVSTTMSVMNGLLSSALLPGEFVEIELVLDIAHNAPQGEILTNFAEISGATDDVGGPRTDEDSFPDGIDNNDGIPTDDEIDNNNGDEDDHDLAEVQVNYFDLALTKTLSTGQASEVAPEDDVNFTITVYNQGTVAADYIEITDYIPACMELNDGDWSGPASGPATYTMSVMNLDLGPNGLEPGDFAQVEITLKVKGDANMSCDLTNIAEISNQTDTDGDPITDIDSDPDGINDDVIGADDEIDGLNGDEDDHDPASVSLLGADLALAKDLATGQASGVALGSEVTFTITVENQGMIAADNIVIADYLDPCMTVVDPEWSAGNPTYTTISVLDGELDPGGLLPGEMVTVDITVLISCAPPTGMLLNEAEIVSFTDEDNNPLEDDDSTPDDNPLNDPPGEDDFDDEELELIYFDLSLNKELADGQVDAVAPGDNVDYDITIVNQGNIPADNIEVVDYIPSCMSLDDGGWLDAGDKAYYTLSVANGELDPGGLLPGEEVTIQIRLLLDNPLAAGCDLTNWSEISAATDENDVVHDDVDSSPDDSDSNDPPGEDDIDDAPINLLEYDLALSKGLAVGQSGIVMVGDDDVTFTITVINQGEIPADEIEVTDYIPPHFELNDPNWTGPLSGPVTTVLSVFDNDLPVGGLLPGAQVMVDITLRVLMTAEEGQTYTNVAEISAGNDEDGMPQHDVDSDPDGDAMNDPPGEDDIDGVDVILMGNCDLAQIKEFSSFDSNGDGTGGLATFTITVVNQGFCDAYDIALVDYILPGWSLDDDDWYMSPFDGNAYYTIDGPLLPGESTTVDISFSVTDFDPYDPQYNYTEITGSEDFNGDPQEDMDSDPDSNPNNDGPPTDDELDNNNNDEDDHDLEDLRIIDLAIDKSIVSTGPYSYGELIEFEICVENEGNAPVNAVTIVDHVPAALGFTAGGVNAGWTDTSPDVYYTFNETLELGDVVCASIFLTFESGGTNIDDYTNVTEITTVIDEFDEENDNDWDSTPNNDDGDQSEDDEDAEVVEVFDLALKKELITDGPFRYGDPVTFELTVVNQGSMTAENIQVVDYIPCGLIFEGSAGWSPYGDGDAITELDGVLFPGEETAVQITLTLTPCDDITGWDNYAEIVSAIDNYGNEGDDIDSDADDIDDNDPGAEPNSPNDDYLDGQGDTPNCCNYTASMQLTDGIAMGPNGVISNDITGIYIDGVLLPLVYPYNGLVIAEMNALETDLESMGYLVSYKYIPSGFAPILELTISGDLGELTAVDAFGIGIPTIATDQCCEYGPDEDDHDVEQVPVLDLALRKTVDNIGPYLFGDIVEFKIEVFNQANTGVVDVDITDYLNEGFAFNKFYVHPVGGTPTANADWTQVGDKITTTIATGGDVFEPQTSRELVIYLEIVEADDVKDWYNYAEISTVFEEEGEEGTDADSTPDDNNDNDGDIVDNEIDNADGDEDDHDIEIVIVAGDVGDTVWKDLDGDGIQDQNEPGVEGVEVSLYTCEGELLETQYTNSDGNYLFENVIPGDYYLSFDFSSLPPGCDWTLQDQGDDEALDSDVNLDGLTDCFTTIGGDSLTFDAGLLPLASLGNYVWHDLDADGVQEMGEPGIEGVEVSLYAADGTLIAMTLTDEDGLYLFTNLYPGDYYVEFEYHPMWNQTPSNQGGNDNLDSDVDGSNGEGTTATTNLEAGEEDLSWDLGLYKCAPIGDLMWYDYNGNNVWDTAENGINGVRVELYELVNGVGVLVDYTYTGHKPNTPSDDGYFKFCAKPGTYYLKFKMIGDLLEPVNPFVGHYTIDSNVDGSYGPHTTNSFTVISDGMNCDMDAGYKSSTSNIIEKDPGVLTTEVASVYGAFEGRNDGDKNNLEFSASLNSSDVYYLIERKVEGEEDYNEIAQILAEPSEEMLTYSLTDYDVTEGGEYAYRLMVVRETGELDFVQDLNIRVKSELMKAVKLYPNPASSEVSIELELSKRSEVQASLISASGRVVDSDFISGEVEAGLNIFRVDVSSVPGGIYTIRLVAGDKIMDKRLVIINN